MLITHSDWSKIIMGLGKANKSALLQALLSYATLKFVDDIGSSVQLG